MYVNKINFNPSLESYLFGSIRNKVSVNSKEEQIGKSIFYLLIYGLIIMVSVFLPIAVLIIETEFFDFLNFSSTILMSIPFDLSLTVFDAIFLPIFIFYHLHKKVS
jgi:Cu/Ag efflux pump CusA